MRCVGQAPNWREVLRAMMIYKIRMSFIIGHSPFYSAWARLCIDILYRYIDLIHYEQVFIPPDHSIAHYETSAYSKIFFLI